MRQVYEDTQFLAADAAEGSQEGGLGVYEDTQFMMGCIGTTGPAQPVLQVRAFPLPACGGAQSSKITSPALCMHDDEHHS